jgi:hypothetical protein
MGIGRLLGLLLIALVGGLVAQAFVGAELRELEALGGTAPPADLTRATRLFWASAAGSFAVALAIGGVLAGLSTRTIRSASFPPAGAEWIGARRHYEGAAAQRLGWLGLGLAALLSTAALAGLVLTVFLASGELW